MSILEIGSNWALHQFDRSGKAMDSLSRQLSSGKKVEAAKDDPVAWSKARKSRTSSKGLDDINESLNLAAMSIRIADNIMDTIGRLIAIMEANLERIIKNYPPYPPGSPERAEYLRAFNGLRKQIDDLTIPPRDMAVQQILADPAVVPGAGDWDVVASEDGAHVTIRSREVHTGPTGLNIPALPDPASDAEIEAAIANLETARMTLAVRRSGLGIDAAGVAASEVFTKKAAAYHRAGAERLEIADMNEVAAGYKSVEIRRTLALESVKGLTEIRSLFVDLLG